MFGGGNAVYFVGKSDFMEIINVGYQYTHPADFHISRPKGSGDYLLLLIRSDAYCILNGEKQEIDANSVLLYRKGTPQYYGARNSVYVNDWVHFDLTSQETEKIEKRNIPFDTVVSVQDVTDLSGFIKNIFNELYSQRPYKMESSGLYLELMLLEIAKGLHVRAPQKNSTYEKKLSKLRNEIYCTPEYDWSIDELSRRLNLSRSYLQHMYKIRFGTSIMADITLSRMERAKYMLSGSDASVSSIAQLCGYHSDVHFMRLFKKITGMTPSQFRAKTAVSQDEVEKGKKHPPFIL